MGSSPNLITSTRGCPLYPPCSSAFRLYPLPRVSTDAAEISLARHNLSWRCCPVTTVPVAYARSVIQPTPAHYLLPCGLNRPSHPHIRGGSSGELVPKPYGPLSWHTAFRCRLELDPIVGKAMRYCLWRDRSSLRTLACPAGALHRK